jgi:hypothetical protein
MIGVGDVSTINKLKDSISKCKDEYKQLEKSHSLLQAKVTSLIEVENKTELEIRDLKDKIRSQQRELSVAKCYEEEARQLKDKVRQRERELISLRGDTDALGEVREQLKSKEKEIIRLKELNTLGNGCFLVVLHML